LSYDADDAEITVLVEGPVDAADMVEVRRQYRQLEHMFRGHIEWAEAVIELGGVVAEHPLTWDERTQTWNQKTEESDETV